MTQWAKIRAIRDLKNIFAKRIGEKTGVFDSKQS
jgi:hypothetical protein